MVAGCKFVQISSPFCPKELITGFWPSADRGVIPSNRALAIKSKLLMIGNWRLMLRGGKIESPIDWIFRGFMGVIVDKPKKGVNHEKKNAHIGDRQRDMAK
jgi:hypothetical protein